MMTRLLTLGNANRKKITGHNRRWPLAAVLLTLVLASATAAPAADQLVPFKGSLQGSELDVFQGPPPGTLAVDGTVTGVATHLGRFTLVYKVTVSLSDGSSAGSAQLTAANGDMIFTTLVGIGTPTDTPGLNQIVEINTITGGTGRFSGAKGSFIVERLVDLGTGVTSGAFHGTITPPGASHSQQ